MTTQFNYTDAFDADSTWIDSVYYNRDTEILSVVTEGRHYLYKNVPLYVFQEGERAPSTGRWFNWDIQKSYKAAILRESRRLDDPINYVMVGRHANGTAPTGNVPWPKHQPTNPDELEYRIIADVKVDYLVKATSLEAAIADFKNNISKYVTVTVKGVQLIDS